jgi:hypothetical protein
MNRQEFSFLDRAAAQEFVGRTVVDPRGESIGVMDGFWLDPSTLRVAFIGVKSSSFPRKTHVVPAADSQIQENGTIRVSYAAECIKEAPTANPEFELAQVEKEEVNAYYGRFVPLHRITSIEEVRPEQVLHSQETKAEEPLKKPSETDRCKIAKGEQSFFDQKGFVTDSMPEVDASRNLRKAAEESKVREQE